LFPILAPRLPAKELGVQVRPIFLQQVRSPVEADLGDPALSGLGPGAILAGVVEISYLLGVNAAPVRWILRMSGAETNKDLGITNLKLIADRGHYLAPYARLLLAVAALRDQDRTTARHLLASLSREFPQNGLYQRELTRIQP